MPDGGAAGSPTLAALRLPARLFLLVARASRAIAGYTACQPGRGVAGRQCCTAVRLVGENDGGRPCSGRRGRLPLCFQLAFACRERL